MDGHTHAETEATTAASSSTTADAVTTGSTGSGSGGAASNGATSGGITSIGSDGADASTEGEDASTSGGPVSPWSSQRELTIAAGAFGTGFDDFPLLVRLDAARIEYDQCADRGDDLRFTDIDGDPLPHQVEHWDPEGTSIVWVGLPRADAAHETLFMAYGNADAPNVEDAAAIWSPRYVGVWHMIDDAGTVHDASGGGHDAFATDAEAIQPPLDGPLGPAFVLTEAAELVVTDDDALFAELGVTVEAWVHPLAAATGQAYVVEHDGYQLALDPNPFAPAGPALHLEFLLEEYLVLFPGGAPVDAWTHLAGWSDTETSSAQLVRNGIAAPVDGLGLGDNGPLQPGGGNLRIGQGFNGAVDELRVAIRAHGEDYLAAQHRSMTDALLTFGPPTGG